MTSDHTSAGAVNSVRRRSGRAAAGCLAVEALECRRLLTAVSWTDADGTGLWSDRLNWSNNQVPRGGDDVTISGDPVTVDANAEVDVDTLNNLGSINIVEGEQLNVGTLDNSGSIRINSEVNNDNTNIFAESTLANSGTITGTGGLVWIYAVGSCYNYGSISTAAGTPLEVYAASLNLEGGVLDGAGGTTLGGSISDIGTLSNSAGDTLTLNQATAQCPVANGGTLNVMVGTDFAAGLSTAAGSTLNLIGGTDTQCDVARTLVNYGSVVLSCANQSDFVNLQCDGGIVNEVGGTITSDGVGENTGIQANLDNFGTVVVLNATDIGFGSSPPVMSVNGDFIQEATGSTTFAVSGATPDEISVSGTAQLGGTVGVVLTGGYQPVVGQKYPVVTYAAASGTVAVASPPGFKFVAQYQPTILNLVASASQDQLAFFQQPEANTPGGVPVGTVRVEALNGTKGVDSSDTSTVTFTLNGGANGALAGMLSEPLVNGVATFSNVSLNAPGTFTLQATDGTDAATTSASFTVEPIELQGTFSGGQSSSATVNVGLTPTNGAAFVPLLAVTNGSINYDTAGDITASGTFTSTQGNLGAPLFIGSLTLPAGAATTSVMTVSSGVQVAGLATTFTAMTLAAGAGGTTNDSRITLGGGFVLPASLGGAQITLPSGTAFSVGSSGFGLTTGDISVSDASFELGTVLQVTAKDMSFNYTSSPEDLKIQGDFDVILSTKGKASNGSSGTTGGLNVGLDLNLSGTNFVEYEPQESPSVKFVGTLAYTDNNATPLFNNWFSITSATLSVNTITEAISGSATVQVPSGKSFTGEIGFLNGYLDSIGLSGSNLAIPVPDVPGLEVQSLGGSLTGLSPTDLNPTVITGTVGLSYGTLVTATGSLTVTLGSGLTVTDISGTASVNFANGEATGTATLDANIAKGTFGLTSLSMTGFNNTVTINGALVASAGGDLYGYESGTVKLPAAFGGTSVSATLQMQIAPALPSVDSYLAGWFQPTVLGVSRTVGLEYTFDGTWHLLLGALPPIPSPALVPDASTAAAQSFTVPAGQPYILLSASWANAASGVPFQVVAPNGTVYSSANLNTAVVATVPALSSSTATTVAVNAPAAGTWQLVLPTTTGLGAVSFQGTAPEPSSSVQVTSPTTAVSAAAAGSVSIGYTATDPNAGAQVSLYYDTVGSGEQGTLIATGLPVGSRTYSWQTPSTLAAGTYHVYAVVTDNVGVPSSAYATGTVVVSAAPTAQVLSLAGSAFYLKLDPDGQLDVWANATGTGTVAESLPMSAVSNILVTGTSGGTTVVVDFSAGDPLPATGLAFIGAAESSNTLEVIGTPGNDAVTVTDSTVTESAAFGSAAIVYGGLSAIAFAGGAGSDTLTQTDQPGDGATLAFTGSTASDTLAVNGGTYTVAAAPAGSGVKAVRFGTVAIAAGAKVAVANPATATDRSVLVVGTLSIGGTPGAWTGTLDLGGNDVVVTGGVLATLTSMAAGGFARGAWTGPGLDSSAAAADAKHLHALGVVQNVTAAGGSTPLYTSFDGVAVTTSAVLVKYTFFGDADLSGAVNAADYGRIDAGFVGKLTGWANGDFNDDGAVDGSDYTLIDNAFDQQAASAAAAVVADPAAVVVHPAAAAVAAPDRRAVPPVRPAAAASPPPVRAVRLPPPPPPLVTTVATPDWTDDRRDRPRLADAALDLLG